jgi:predicted DCC family thiol-disulfide oxidoreductase YuxK
VAHLTLPPDFQLTYATQVAKGADAVLTAYQAVGLGWLVWVFRLKIFSWMINGAYSIVSKHR